MASEEGSSQEERKRKVCRQESSAGEMDVDLSSSSKRPCLEQGSSGNYSVQQLARQHSLEVSQQLDLEQLHRQGDIEEEQVKRVDGESLRRGANPFSSIRRVGSAPGNSCLESLPEEEGGVIADRAVGLKKNQPWNASGRLATSAGAGQGSMTSNRSSESNASVGSKRAIDEVEGSASGREVSGMGVSGVSHEGRLTSVDILSPGAKHRRIEEEVSSSSEDEEGGVMSDQENGRSAVDQLSSQTPPSLLETKATVSIASHALGSSFKSALAPFEGPSVGGRRQVLFPPLGGGMKRSGSRADLTEEKQPTSSSGGGLSLFERLTRGVPPVVVREVSSGASVRSEGSQGGSQSSKREEARRKELDALPPSLRRNMFLSRTESERSGLGTSDGAALNQRDVDRMLKQGPQGQGFKAKPPTPLAAAAAPSTAARFVLPDGRKFEKAKSESMVPGPTVTDETMPEGETLHSMQSVSVTSVQGRKHATVEDEFEAYFAQMGISM